MYNMEKKLCEDVLNQKIMPCIYIQNISLIKDQEMELFQAKWSSLGDDAYRFTSSKKSSFPEVPYLLEP